ncbi:MAG: CDP-alcohol phosphatidyltransferase family protein [Alphaproteobacteria bacterium]|nr:CDP-alcohol phosphatidyltransferase family protein [Alphaproteobacteria bacterium]
MKKFVNFLSAFRIASAFAIIPTLLLGWYWTTFILYVLASLSDFFDGYLARKYNCVSKLGGVMDHIGDKLLVANTLIVLSVVLMFLLPAFIPGFPSWTIIVPVILMISRELYISGLREFLGTRKIEMPVPKARFSMGKIKTTLQMVATCALLLGLCMPQLVLVPSMEIFAIYAFFGLMYGGVICLWLALVASLWSATQYTHTFLGHLKKIK